jgi:hypothetical protein
MSEQLHPEHGKPSARVANRTEAGSCNSCQDRTSSTVIEVTLLTVTFRVCDKCAEQIRDALKTAIQKSQTDQLPI